MRACNQCGRSCDDEHRFCPSCGFPIGALRAASGDPMIGRTIGAGYTILEAVGAGGMGKVYRAERGALGKTFAVKVIHPHLAGDDNAVKRFNQEAHTSSRINHPNAVVVLDFGRTDDELLYLVMEFLRGRDLTRVVWELGRLPVSRATDIMRQVLAALSEAHQLGIVHRDIKPENILVEPLSTGGDFVKVVDFGLAKIRDDQSPGVTSPGLVCGTPDYMAPEQARGLDADPRADLYSAAVVLYQCVTGRLPFEAESAAEALDFHVNTPPPDPRIFVPELSPRFVETLLRALAKDPDARFQTAVDFAEALRLAVSDPVELSDAVPCPACGEAVVRGARFCGHCGRAMSPRGSASVAAAEPAPAPDLSALPMVERDDALSLLALGLARASQGPLVPLALVGDEGAGRSQLVTALSQHARRRGGSILRVRPDPLLAGVAYHPVRATVRGLLGLAPGEDPMSWLAERQSEDASFDPSLRAGFLELFSPVGPVELDAAARSDAAVRAVCFALQHARGLDAGEPAILAFEYAHRMDGASLRVLRALMSRPPSSPSLLLITCSAQLVPSLPRCETITLRPLSVRGVAQMVDAARPLLDVDTLLLPAQELPPMHVEQLLRWHAEGGGDAPPRLVDLIAHRLERLSSSGRRLLPCIAAFGECNAADASAALGSAVEPALFATLHAGGWIAPVEGDEGRWRIAHPMILDVLNDSVPAAVRTTLHRAALQAEDRALPVEVEAMHAELTGAVFLALLKLGQMGDQAMARGDHASAAQALRRGVELARREYLKGDADLADDTLSIFARKLGEALVSAGDYAEAEGVLREGIGVTTVDSQEWIRLQCVLGSAYFLRGRHGASQTAFDAATSAATRRGLHGLATEMLMARAELEVSAGADEWALRTLTRADALLDAALASASEGAPLWRQRAEVLLWLARAQRVVGVKGGEEILDRARVLAERAGLKVLHAQCDAEAAERAELAADRRQAMRLWHRASQDARDAGDVALAADYEQRMKRLGAH
ncbi:MAG: protein kinase [Polyangiales bacterium]